MRAITGLQRMAPMSAASLMVVLSTVGCSAQNTDKLACSSPTVTSTVVSIIEKQFRRNSNEMIEQMLDISHTTMSLEAIRTVSSEPRRSLCEATLRVKLAFAPNALGKAIEAEARKQDDGTQEERYQVQLTDDGEAFVTVMDPKRNADGLSSPAPDVDEGDE